MSERLLLSAPDVGDPDRLRLWIAIYRTASTGLDALDAWEFWQERLDHLRFLRYLFGSGRLQS